MSITYSEGAGPPQPTDVMPAAGDAASRRIRTGRHVPRPDRGTILDHQPAPAVRTSLRSSLWSVDVAVDRPVAAVRRRARVVLGIWQVDPRVIDDAELVVCELVTNALTHTDRARIDLGLCHDGTDLVVSVWDADVQRPLPRFPQSVQGDDAESGRGLRLVQGLAQRAGCRVHPGGHKEMWASLAL